MEMRLNTLLLGGFIMNENREEFINKKYTVIKNFVPFLVRDTLEKYSEFRNKRYPEDNLNKFCISNGYDETASNYCWYADPLTEVILHNSTHIIEEITNLELYPTYSYLRVYVGGNELKKHVDRVSCEISLSCNIASNGGVWPLYFEHEDEEGVESCVHLEPGDAVLYRGCELFHWRDKMQVGTWGTQMMLHYVDANGPHAEFKYDKRASLGMPHCLPNV